MIRVLHHGLSQTLGGIEASLSKLAGRFDADQFAFGFVVPAARKHAEHITALEELGFPVYAVPPRRRGPIAYRAAFDAILRQGRFDVLHSHVNTLSDVAPVRSAVSRGLHTILHSRSAGAPPSPTTVLLHHANRARARHWPITRVAVSGAAGRWLFGQNTSFQVITNGLDLGRFRFDEARRRATRRDLKLDDNEFVVGHIGRFDQVKNHDFLVSVFKHVIERRPQSRLVLVGRGLTEQAVHSRLSALGLQDRALMLGERRDVPDVLCALDTFVFPSLYEGFPNALVEAQASGLPCVVSDRIAEEARVNGHCTALSLDESPAKWATEVLASTAEDDRAIVVDDPAFARLSVEHEVETLTRLYSGLCGR